MTIRQVEGGEEGPSMLILADLKICWIERLLTALENYLEGLTLHLLRMDFSKIKYGYQL